MNIQLTQFIQTVLPKHLYLGKENQLYHIDDEETYGEYNTKNWFLTIKKKEIGYLLNTSKPISYIYHQQRINHPDICYFVSSRDRGVITFTEFMLQFHTMEEILNIREQFILVFGQNLWPNTKS